MNDISEMLKGVLEGLMLEVIGREEVYGYEIVKRLHQLDFLDIAEGTVYTILMRLEKKGWVNITKRPSELGPPRKFYQLNSLGEQKRQDFWEKWQFISSRIEILKNGVDHNEFK